MKKLIILLLCCVGGLVQTYAQSNSLSAAELSFRNRIETFLKEEGYVPTIDNDDNSLNWKREGMRYWLTVAGDGPYYIEMHEAGISLEGKKRAVMMEAANDANLNKRCGKASVGTDYVLLTVEYYTYSIDEFKNTFYDEMKCVNNAREAVNEYYRENAN